MRGLIWFLLVCAIIAVAWEYYKPTVPVEERIATVVDLTGTADQRSDSTSEAENDELPDSPAAPIANTTDRSDGLNTSRTEDVSLTKYTLLGDTTLSWLGRKVGGEHYGTIPITGSIYINEQLEIQSGSIEMDMTRLEVTSIDNNAINETLKGEEYFAAERYPTARFYFLSYQNGKITGLLTMKGKTKQISFPATVSIEEDTVTANASFALDRTERGVRGGVPAVSQYMEIEFMLVWQVS